MRKLFRRLFVIYFYFIVVAGHVGMFGYLLHKYKQEGLPPTLYVHYLTGRIDDRIPGSGEVLRSAVFGSGLLTDPSNYFQEDLLTDLPSWQGRGASKFRAPWRDVASGRDRLSLGREALARGLRDVTVAVPSGDAGALMAAVADAEPGTVIGLAGGTYRLPTGPGLRLAKAGRAGAPITLRGSNSAASVIVFDGPQAFEAAAPDWVVENLIVRGRCSGTCDRVFAVADGALRLVVHNVFASDTDTLVEAAGPPADGVRVIGNTLFGGREVIGGPAAVKWQDAKNRHIDLSTKSGRVTRVCPVGGDLAGAKDCDETGLKRALAKAQVGQVLLLRTGDYVEAAKSSTDRLTLIAEPFALMRGKSIDDKGALVLSGRGLWIDGLECFGIEVKHGNGACIRFEKGDLRLSGVHFYENQNGILTTKSIGTLEVLDSVLHTNGYGWKPGRTHNIYVNGGVFRFLRSYSLTALNEGHELKSRAKETVIEDSVFASLNSRDSRLIDIANGGKVSIKGNILAKGPWSSNGQLIAVGLEVGNKKYKKYEENYTEVMENLVFMERFRGNTFVTVANVPEARVEGNFLIGRGGESYAGRNQVFESRDDAGFPGYPVIIAQ